MNVENGSSVLTVGCCFTIVMKGLWITRELFKNFVLFSLMSNVS